jgi:DNA-binding IclR family transcriptional regulator
MKQEDTKAKNEKKDKYVLSSVDKTLKVLDFLGVRDNIGMMDICRGCSLDKTSVFKILYTLERKDYVFKTANSKYRLGVKFMNYGDLVAQRQDLIEIATPYMQQLRDSCDESVHLGTLNTIGKVIIMHKEKPQKPHSADTRIGFEIDAYTNSLGKVLLANLSLPMLHSIVENYRFRAHTPYTIMTPEALYSELDTIRTQGYGADSDEQYVGFSSVSAPIFNAGRQCMVGISLVCPTDTFSQKKAALIQEILPITQEISQRLGYLGEN